MDDPTPISVDDATETRRHLGRRIQQRRQKLGLSVIALAERLGVSKESVYGYENGSRAINSYDLPRLASILATPIGYFFGEYMPPVSSPSDRSGSRSWTLVLTEAQMEIHETFTALPLWSQRLVLEFAKMVRDRLSDGQPLPEQGQLWEMEPPPASKRVM